MAAGVRFQQEHKFSDGTELLKSRENIVRVRIAINCTLENL